MTRKMRRATRTTTPNDGTDQPEMHSSHSSRAPIWLVSNRLDNGRLVGRFSLQVNHVVAAKTNILRFVVLSFEDSVTSNANQLHLCHVFHWLRLLLRSHLPAQKILVGVIEPQGGIHIRRGTVDGDVWHFYHISLH